MKVSDHDDSESQHCKEVYAYYGLAMYQVQCVERSLALALATEFGPGPTRITRQQYDELLGELFQDTFGRLIRRLRRETAVPPAFDATTQAALEKRNWLAHHYFWDRAPHFVTESGRDAMLAELQSAVAEFEYLNEQLTRITDAWRERHGITEEMIAEERERLIAGTDPTS